MDINTVTKILEYARDCNEDESIKNLAKAREMKGNTESSIYISKSKYHQGKADGLEYALNQIRDLQEGG